MNVILGRSSLSPGRLVRSFLPENKIKEFERKKRDPAAKIFKSGGKNGFGDKNSGHSQPGGRRCSGKREWRRLALAKAPTPSP